MNAPIPSAPLANLLPRSGEPTLSTDEILNRFVGWVASTGLSLYPAQEEAILELLGGKHVVLNTPTGSGKSLVATAFHFQMMAEGKRSFYTCPIKALVNEKFFALCDAFGAENVGMQTGDATINRDAPIVCCTAEVLMNLALRDPSAKVDAVIMDEFHYYADKERGVAWQIPLLALENTVFLLMSATLGDMTEINKGIEDVTGREVAMVRSAQRPVPLDFTYSETPLHETIEELVSKGKAPIYLVNFTQRAAAEQAQNLMSVNFSSKEDKERIREALFDAKFDTPYGKDFQKFLRHGVGMHHAGLLPKYRLLVEKLSQKGMLKVISGTDTLGVGVNIPIRTVLFTQLCKFDGEKVGILSVRDFQQVAGRAGRKGFDTQGSVVVQAPEHVIENIKLEAKAATGKKVVKQKPPQKGYAHWDATTLERLQNRLPEPLESRFQVNHGMLLNLLQSETREAGGGYGRLVKLVKRSHESEYVKRQHLKKSAVAFRTLRTAGIVQVMRGEGGWPASVRVSPDLQRDFSLNHTLSLYLLETLALLDSTTETYALDVLSLVEAILENPDVVLYAQLHKLKGQKIEEMKAAGIEYEERMEKLEELEWPKPNRDFIYGTFNQFAAKHPWVGQENIRPKSIAREMAETFMSFHDYVREYGLQRSEGVLLRHLHQVYKALVQTVPESARTEELDDLIAELRLTLKTVDSSLLDEWEHLQHPGMVTGLVPRAEKVEAPRPLWERPKDLAARVRGELHRLMKLLADQRYEEALEALAPGEIEWTAESLGKEMERFFAEHAKVIITPAARRPNLTHLASIGPRQWSARQTLLDAEGNGDWMIDTVVDLRGEFPEEKPLIQLRRIGI